MPIKNLWRFNSANMDNNRFTLIVKGVSYAPDPLDPNTFTVELSGVTCHFDPSEVFPNACYIEGLPFYGVSDARDVPSPGERIIAFGDAQAQITDSRQKYGVPWAELRNHRCRGYARYKVVDSSMVKYPQITELAAYRTQEEYTDDLVERVKRRNALRKSKKS